jgi:hypothetical protein
LALENRRSAWNQRMRGVDDLENVVLAVGVM